MANIKVSDFPATAVPAAADIFYTKQGAVEKKLLMSLLNSYLYGNVAEKILAIDYNSLPDGVSRNSFATHSPDGSANMFVVISMGATATTSGTQIAIDTNGVIYTRTEIGSTWGSWSSKIAITGAVDYDTLTTPGRYFNSLATNSPDGTAAQFSVEVIANAIPGTVVTQVAVRVSDSAMFSRSYSSSIWTSWQMASSVLINSGSSAFNWQTFGTSGYGTGDYYVYGAAQTNAPDGSTNSSWFVNIINKVGTTNVIQIYAIRQDTGDVFVAQNNSGAWTTSGNAGANGSITASMWKRVLTSGRDIFIATPGSGTWVAPLTGIALITIVAGGGGGGDSSVASGGGGGGGGATLQIILNLIAGTSYSYTVGTGGTSSGGNGGASVFSAFTANGGTGGNSNENGGAGGGGGGIGGGGGGGGGGNAQAGGSVGAAGANATIGSVIGIAGGAGGAGGNGSNGANGAVGANGTAGGTGGAFGITGASHGGGGGGGGGVKSSGGIGASYASTWAGGGGGGGGFYLNSTYTGKGGNGNSSSSGTAENGTAPGGGGGGGGGSASANGGAGIIMIQYISLT